MKHSIVRIVFIISLIFNLFIGIVFMTPLTEQLYRPLIVNEPLRKSQALVVLSGDSYPPGFLGFKSLLRLNKALQIYRQKLTDKIVCIGGTRLPAVNKSIAEIMKETLILYGVSAQDIIVHDGSLDTYHDIAGLLADYHKEFDFNKCIFVTSPFHSFRVKKILEKKKINAIVVSADPYELYPNLWTSRWDLFKTVMREYMVICYSRMKAWI